MNDMIVIAIIAVILISVIAYIVSQKKKGVKCIGCSAGSCNNHSDKNHACSCGSENDNINN